MKRLSVALAAIGLTAACGAFAALPAATDPTLVNVPQLPGGFYIGASALYLQPSATNGDLDYASVTTGTSSTSSSKLYSADPGYDWGFDVEAGYIFANTGNNVELKYTYLDTGDAKDSINTNGISPVNDSGFIGSAVGAVAKANYRINQVDLTAGQLINVGCRLRLQPVAGLRYASVDRDFDNAYAAAVSGTEAAPQHEANAQDSNFSGIGPLAGLNASYYVGMGVGVVAHADAALLVGSIDAETKTADITNTDGALSTVNYDFKNDDVNRVVPVTDMKLGVDYTYLFNNAANSDVTAELGWQFSHYYNAVDQLLVSTEGAGSIIGSRTSDVGFQGPYLNLTFHA